MERPARLRIAILGGATNSAVGMAHNSAIRLSSKFDLCAGCFSRNERINKETANSYGVDQKRAYKNIDELLKKERDRIDAVAILVPSTQHYEMVMRCLKDGIPAICEKPLACSLDEIRNIKEERDRTNGYVSVIYNYLGYPMIRELKYLIGDGQLGEVEQVIAEMPQEGFIRVKSDGSPIVPQEWRLHETEIPMISLDLGAHLHILVKYLIEQQPRMVFATSNTYGNFEGIKDSVSAIISYTNNVTCNMWYAKTALGTRNGLSLRVFGSKGSARWVQESPEYLEMADSYGHKYILDRGSPGLNISNQKRYNRFKPGHPSGFIEALANYYDDIAEELIAFKHGHYSVTSSAQKNSFGVDEALEGLSLLATIEKSSVTRAQEAMLI